MTAMELRLEFIEFIKRTDDIRRLKWMKSMLFEQVDIQEQIEDMIRAADLSDEDIAAGRTRSIEDVERWMEEQKRKS